MPELLPRRGAVEVGRLVVVVRDRLQAREEVEDVDAGPAPGGDGQQRHEAGLASLQPLDGVEAEEADHLVHQRGRGLAEDQAEDDARDDDGGQRGDEEDRLEDRLEPLASDLRIDQDREQQRDRNQQDEGPDGVFDGIAERQEEEAILEQALVVAQADILDGAGNDVLGAHDAGLDERTDPEDQHREHEWQDEQIWRDPGRVEHLLHEWCHPSV